MLVSHILGTSRENKFGILQYKAKTQRITMCTTITIWLYCASYLQQHFEQFAIKLLKIYEPQIWVEENSHDVIKAWITFSISSGDTPYPPNKHNTQISCVRHMRHLHRGGPTWLPDLGVPKIITWVFAEISWILLKRGCREYLGVSGRYSCQSSA